MPKLGFARESEEWESASWKLVECMLGLVERIVGRWPVWSAAVVQEVVGRGAELEIVGSALAFPWVGVDIPAELES